MAFINELNSEDCGCDNNYFSVINESPLLSGSQENNFDPINNKNNVLNYNNSNNLNNLNTNNLNTNKLNTNNLNTNKSNKSNNIFNSNNLNTNKSNNILNSNNLNTNKSNNMYANNNNKMNNDLQQILNNNVQTQNNNQISEHQIKNLLNSIPNTNIRNPSNLPDLGTMRNDVEQIELNNQLQNQMVVNEMNNSVVSNNQHKYISTMFNYVVVVLVAIAINDLAKYYINRSIKFQNGTHMYYIYYTIGLIIVLYIVSKYVNNQ